jgi:hypothetical protein
MSSPRESALASVQAINDDKFDIQKAIADGGDVCLFHDLTRSSKTIFGCSWYHVANGKIDSLKVIFDPRPMLEGSK